MKIFKINKRLEVVCEWQKTRIAFKHVATLLRDGDECESVKICYLNRTWERYTFESVLQKLLDKASLNDAERRAFKKTIANGGKDELKSLKFVGAIAKLGDIFHVNDQKASNDWKKRMLNAGLGNQGLIMPEDWETLSEEEKESRLNGAIAQLSV